MLTILTKPGESYDQAVLRNLLEQAICVADSKDLDELPRLRDLANCAEHSFAKLTTPAAGSLHPDDCTEELRERMSRLAESFPTLKGRPGVRPWHPATLMDQWGEAWASNASRQAMAFVLSVWNGENEIGQRFRATWAMGLWDHRHRAAFVAWAQKPWWG